MTTKVVVRVEGGLVTDVLATDPNLDVDVIDLDGSQFSSEHEEADLRKRREDMERISKDPRFHAIY